MPDRGYKQAAAGKAAHCIPEAGYCYLAAGNPRALLHRVLFGLYSQRCRAVSPGHTSTSGRILRLPAMGCHILDNSSCSFPPAKNIKDSYTG